jgi:hypothetical protein
VFATSTCSLPDARFYILGLDDHLNYQVVTKKEGGKNNTFYPPPLFLLSVN